MMNVLVGQKYNSWNTDAYFAFKGFAQISESQKQKKIKSIETDNGGEFDEWVELCEVYLSHTSHNRFEL